MYQILLVAFGGALGSVCRYLVGVGALRLMGPSFPWGTLAVNVAGSFAIGILAELIVARSGASAELRLLLITGFLGGFTTFSAFSLELVLMIGGGRTLAALSYALLSTLGSIVLLAGGLWLARPA